MENKFNDKNKELDFLAFTNEEDFNHSSNKTINQNYRINCNYNYFGIKSGLNYDNHEDLSFWEY